MKAESQERIWKAIDATFKEMAEGKSREEQFAEISEFFNSFNRS